eukprot:472292_1
MRIYLLFVQLRRDIQMKVMDTMNQFSSALVVLFVAVNGAETAICTDMKYGSTVHVLDICTPPNSTGAEHSMTIPWNTGVLPVFWWTGAAVVTAVFIYLCFEEGGT